MRRALFLVPLIACGTSPAADREQSARTPVETARTSPEPTNSRLDSSPPICAVAPDWRYEKIALPPEFAPSLAKGIEILYFAPGMFDANSDEYWSYVFSLSFDEPTELRSETALEKLLVTYYDGLIGAVGKSKTPPITPIKTRVFVADEKTRFTAHVALTDAFVTGKEIDLRVELEVAKDRPCLRAAVSAGGLSPALWHGLRRAMTCLPCPP